ncbi:NlpC/P60 family protein [Aliivibrio kagoshimensis]|uniref:NlpC/P60 family protein n=1 Tax=Aliivibrio kagoshimensis TaxID=2910230 RepID=UPI003D0C5485
MRYLLIIALLSVAGCSTTPSVSTSPVSQNKFVQTNSIFTSHYNNWKGTPYRLGGVSKTGIDCSAFVQITMRDVYRVDVARTTLQQQQQGKLIARGNQQPGDLIFFKTGHKVRHVGVYLGEKQFMHASTSKGVIISRTDNPYWASKFWKIKRVM